MTETIPAPTSPSIQTENKTIRPRPDAWEVRKAIGVIARYCEPLQVQLPHEEHAAKAADFSRRADHLESIGRKESADYFRRIAAFHESRSVFNASAEPRRKGSSGVAAACAYLGKSHAGTRLDVSEELAPQTGARFPLVHLGPAPLAKLPRASAAVV